jgi:MFS family permease
VRPRLAYGWVLVITLGMTETISWGILYYAFTVYLAPMEAELGWSRGDMTGAFSVASLLSGLAAIPVGRWLDARGPRLLMTVGSMAATALVVGWATVQSLPQLYLIWAAIGLTMSATLYDPAFATVSRWFDRQRVKALTVVTLMAGFASTIFIPLAGALVQSQGWRQSLLSLAVILGIGTIPAHALILRRSPSRHSAEGDRGMAVGQVIRHASFRWLTIAFWLTSLTTVAIGVHLLPYLQDRGYDATFAATITGSIGAMQVLARLALAPFGSRLTPRALGIGVLSLQPLAIVVLLLVRSTPGLLVFVVLFGAQRGLATLVRPALIADLYGVARYASIAGVLQFALSLAQAAAPVGAGVAYDALRSYEPIFWSLAVISACAVVALIPARPERVQATVSAND